MAVQGSRAVDWRDAAAYAPLLHADRAVFAWEWLRRDPAYRAAASRALSAPHSQAGPAEFEAARRWGLHAFEDPDRAAPLARPVWHMEACPAVLTAEARRAGGAEDQFEIERLGDLAGEVLRIGRAQHVLLSDGLHNIRLDITGDPLDRGPVSLAYRLHGIAGAERPLETLRRFLSLYRTGGFNRLLHPLERRAPRWVLMLRAHDALEAGARQREIAANLLGAEASQPGWRHEVPGARSQVQRLGRAANTLAAGGYRRFLE
jgi:hypothetical protein